MPKQLLGSHHMRSTARHRVANKVDSVSWIVSGGSAEHAVALRNNTFECDCDNYGRNGICCHVIAVMLSRGMSLEI